MSAGPDAVGVNFGLLLEEGDGASCGDEDDEPVTISRRFDGIEGEGVWSEGSGEVVCFVALRWVGGVEVSPVGLGAGPCFVGEAHGVASPVEGKACISSFCERDGVVERGGLAAAVDIENGRQVGSCFWVGVKGCDAGRSSLKEADLVAHNAADDFVLFPLFEGFGLKRGCFVEFVVV